MIKIAHIITDLDTGGAENMLFNLLKATSRDAFIPEVISLTNIGPVGEKIKDLGIPVNAIGMTRGIPNPAALFKLASLLKSISPDIIQTWMYHANLAGSLAAAIGGIKVPIVWSIHHSNLDPGSNKTMSIMVARAGSMIARTGFAPKRIVCCSQSTISIHAEIGFPEKLMCFIPNGIDVNVFNPQNDAREAILNQLGLKNDAILIGLPSRYDPLKDHATFLTAAAIVASKQPRARFLMCGEGIDKNNHELMSLISEINLNEFCFTMGRREDMPRFYSGIDIAVSSSAGEAFPLAIGEAMSCGIPCAATDAGDSADIIGGCGVVVPVRDPEKLAEAILELIDLPEDERRHLGETARDAIVSRFSLSRVAEIYEKMYHELIEK